MVRYKNKKIIKCLFLLEGDPESGNHNWIEVFDHRYVFLVFLYLISHVCFRSQEWHFIEAAPAGLHPFKIEVFKVCNIVVFRIRGDAGRSL